MELGGPSVYAHEVVEQHVDATLRLAARLSGAAASCDILGQP